MGLTDKDFTEQRNESTKEGVKGLFLLNGGAAVALLAFLQAIWKEGPSLRKGTIVSVFLFGLGAFIAGWVHYVRYNSAWEFQFSSKESGERERNTYRSLFCLSLYLFLFGVLVFGVEACRNIGSQQIMSVQRQGKASNLKSNQNQSNSNENGSTNGNEATVVVAEQRPTRAEQQDSQTDSDHPFDFWEWSRTSSPADMIAAVAAVVLVCYTAKTLKSLRDQVTETAKAANATLASVNVMQLVERPYIYVSEVKLFGMKANERPTALVHFQNSGGTPAINVHVTIGMSIRESAEVPREEFNRPPVQRSFTIGAGGELRLPLSSNTKFTSQQADDWNRGAGKLFAMVYGKISYDDNVGSPRTENKYAALYMNWELPRPQEIPSFWINNGLSDDFVKWDFPRQSPT